MKHGSLFSGIGGFDLAAEWMGWENVFHCEKEPFCQKVLKYYWPKAELFTDITKSDFTKYANTIDILTGGFPCQPYSTAGKRLGKEDERHLWPQKLRAIREIQPPWIVGENVRGLTNWNGGMVFDEVQADLEAEGYEVLPFLLPACAVNAPHRRDRIWFIAYAGHTEPQGRKKFKEGQQHDGRREARSFTSSFGGIWNATHSNGGRFQRSKNEKERQHTINGNAWDFFPTQSAICDGNDGISWGLDPETISFKDWREASIKAGGNAIVPQVVFEIFKAIEAFEQLLNSDQGSTRVRPRKAKSGLRLMVTKILS